MDGLGQEVMSTLIFIGLIVSWVVSRIYYFPTKIIRSWVYEHGPRGVPYFYPFLCGLVILQILHVYWFVLIIKVALRKIFGGKISDIREEDVADPKKKSAKNK